MVLVIKRIRTYYIKIVIRGCLGLYVIFENKRPFCCIDNICFIIKEFIDNNQMRSGIYNITDEDLFLTHELISMIARRQSKKNYIFRKHPNS